MATRLALTLTALALLAACGDGKPAAAPAPPLAQQVKPLPRAEVPGAGVAAQAVPKRWFAATSFWNRPLPASAPLDRRSGDWVEHLVAKVRDKGHAWINTTSYSIPVYTVPESQPRVRVKIDYPTASYDEEFASVPVPDDWKPAAGADARAAIWQPSTDTMWEFWQIRRGTTDNGMWHARTAGRIQNVSTDDGLFEPHPPQEAYGAAATVIPTVPGLITPEELRRGRIEHVVSLAIPHPLHLFWWTWPAQRSDGDSMDPLDIPEGARFRLPPSVDIAKLRLPRAAAVIARAVQKYGLVISDRSEVVHFYAQDPLTLGVNPYPALFGGLSPDELLERFPWGSLVALRSQMNQPLPAAGRPLRSARRASRDRARSRSRRPRRAGSAGS